MTKEDIYKMVRESDLSFLLGDNWMMHHEFEYFASLVASAEREACIVDIQMHIPRSGRHTPEYQMAMRMLERIRARGQA